MPLSLRSVWAFAIVLLCSHSLQAVDPNVSPELKNFSGDWEVVELVEDGKVIPQEAIRSWLPSGGKVEIAENAIIFTSPSDGKKHVKVFSIDATKYPPELTINTQEGIEGWGIFRFDEGRLVLCLSHPTEAARPTDFSASAGSKRMLMVLKRPSELKPAAPAKPTETAKTTPPAATPSAVPPGTTGVVLTDAEVRKALIGTWKFTDSVGALFSTFNPNGTFSTVREVLELRIFQKVFVQTPVSSGTWKIENGRLKFVVLTSTHWDRVNKEFDFIVRSISATDLIFVDYLGHVGRATRVAP
ncbi:hypothetical protein KOR42_07620 [Thalassoglobus neptunius]|uniref:TIGR03067 domain-containing protein n=1 Tax=Thalassoglobus neptunius TaxID=1938619 RepID=A0A5C5X501_9PLAN|nr:TIGR03067 domain-containing protein [Thalassoglobus neptunius]TWT57401.1 hypothetical protein KOR42_07620 [Thalassoglobus neptunius]